MLHDLDSTLKTLIIERGRINRNEIDVVFDAPTSEWSSSLSRPTINCWCYDLRENVKLRNMQHNVTRNGRQARVSLPPMRLDVTYLVTAWATRPEDEHRLLWRALGALTQVAKLKPESCQGSLRQQPFDLPVTVAQMGAQSINMSDLWSVLDNQMRLGFTVLVTLAHNTERGFDAPLVLEAQVGVGQSHNPPDETLHALDITIKAGKPDETPDNETSPAEPDKPSDA